MGKKDKKKGKGAEKTAAKTEKKAMQKAKKELAAKGEADIEELIAEFQERDRQVNYVGEEKCSAPSPRSGFSFCSHPDKDELILFAGEFYNGSRTAMYNDLYFYNIKKDIWSILRTSEKPPPRCSQQIVPVSQSGGQLWMFGGEFASPTRSSFHHYKDLWVFHFAERRWEQIKATGGPSARSGHRMVLSRKRIILFGGFHESLRDYKYFNDVFIFDLENYKWTKIEPSGSAPSPRSGCQMAALSDGRILIYGGYSRMKVKKDVDKGVMHTDMFYLTCDEKSGVPKWKWSLVRQTGIAPSPRSGFSIAVASGNRAFMFGGVHDEDSEETLSSIFQNDLYALELEKGRWLPIAYNIKSDNSERKRRRKVKDNDSDEDSDHGMQGLSITSEPNVEVKMSEDNVFTLKIETPQPTCSFAEDSASGLANICEEDGIKAFVPHSRMNAALAINHSILYLYGGLFEDGDRQFTLSDLYSYDLHKCSEWKTIIAPTIDLTQWCGSDESSSGEDGDEEDSDGSGDSDANDSDEMDTT